MQMPAQTQIHSLANASCFASARRWRTQAEVLRDDATACCLTSGQRSTLLREAEAAERMADWWLDGIEKP